MKGKLPLVIGLGTTGSSLINYLSNFHEEIFLIEDTEANINLDKINQKNLNINVNPLLSNDLFLKISKIYPSPGVSLNHEIFELAKRNQVPISSDIQEFLEKHKSIKILVTGTNGKTSTCLYIKHLMEFLFPKLKINALGNIGEPVLDFINEEIDVSIIEISSFQLELLNEIEFEIGLLLNIEQDHLDRHDTFENYKEIKEKVLKNSTFNISFDKNNYFDKNFKNYNQLKLPKNFIESSVFSNWPLHDIQNLKASIEVLKVFIANFKSVDLNDDDFYLKIQKSFKNFTKLPHRFEFINSFKGINFINDSKATNLDAMIKAVNSVHHQRKDHSIHLICGGDLKGQDILNTDLSDLKNVKNICIYGKDKEIIFDSIHEYSNCCIEKDLDTAFKNTLSKAKIGDYVLLSPACSSLDMFRDYQERGNRFKSLIQGL